MQQEAARLRAAVGRLETTGGLNKAVPSDFLGLCRQHGAWVMVRRVDVARHAALARELRAVEAKIAAAGAADAAPTPAPAVDPGMVAYRTRMEAKAGRLRAELARLDDPHRGHPAGNPDHCNLCRMTGGRPPVCRPDPARREALAGALRWVEERLAAALALPAGGRLLVVLVGCVAQKRPAELDERGRAREWPAADVYTSPLWVKRRAYAERQAPGAWAILSARHGLLRPDEPIAPYDATLGELSVRERDGWGHHAAGDVLDFGPGHALRVELHAGEPYCRELVGRLERAGAEVVRPVRGLAIGQQLAWYREQEAGAIDAPPAAGASSTTDSVLTLKCQNGEDAEMPQQATAQAPTGADVPRLEQEAARLRAALAGLEHVHASRQPVDPGQVGVRRERGRWVVVQLGRDYELYQALARELADVEAALTAAGGPLTPAAPAPTVSDVDQRTSQLLAVLESSWAAIRRQYPEVPAAVMVVAAGSDRRQGLFKWGHFAALRWRRRQVDGEEGGGAPAALPEVLVAGEGLERPALEVFGTLLHEAAHGVADVRQVRDTSRDGRYHNRRYRAIAETMGMDVEEMEPYGHARTTVHPETAALFADQVEELAAALVLFRIAEAAPGRRRRTTAGGAGDDGQDQDDGTRAGEDRDDREDDEDGGRRRDYNLVPALCACDPPRRIRAARSTLAAGAITCGVCGADFEAAEPDA
jgi:hypothetical protein